MSFIGYLFYTSFLLACGLPFDFFNNVLQNEKFFQFWLSLIYRYFHSYHIAICFQFVQLSCFLFPLFCLLLEQLNILCDYILFKYWFIIYTIFIVVLVALWFTFYIFNMLQLKGLHLRYRKCKKKKKSLFRDFLLLLKVDPSEGEVAIIPLSEGASQPGDWSLAMGWETV